MDCLEGFVKKHTRVVNETDLGRRHRHDDDDDDQPVLRWRGRRGAPGPIDSRVLVAIFHELLLSWPSIALSTYSVERHISIQWWRMSGSWVGLSPASFVSEAVKSQWVWFCPTHPSPRVHVCMCGYPDRPTPFTKERKTFRQWPLCDSSSRHNYENEVNYGQRRRSFLGEEKSSCSYYSAAAEWERKESQEKRFFSPVLGE